MLVIAPLIAAASSLVGVAVSYYLDVASGGAVVVVNAIVFFAVYLLHPTRGLVARIRRTPRVVA